MHSESPETWRQDPVWFEINRIYKPLRGLKHIALMFSRCSDKVRTPFMSFTSRECADRTSEYALILNKVVRRMPEELLPEILRFMVPGSSLVSQADIERSLPALLHYLNQIKTSRDYMNYMRVFDCKLPLDSQYKAAMYLLVS